MIGVTRDSARRVEGQQDLRTKFPHPQRKIGNHALQVQPVQLAVGIVEDDAARNFEYLAGGGKFLAPHDAELLIVTRSAAMRGCLPGRQAEDAGFHAALAVKTQRAAKAAGFVIRMRGHHHHAQHGGIVHFRDALPSAVHYAPGLESRVSASASCSSMNASTSWGTGAFQTGAKDWRCSGEGPCSRKAARWRGVL